MEYFKNISYLDNIANYIDANINKKHGIKPCPTSFIEENLTRAVDNGMVFHVKYVDVKDTNTSFIMCCYPDIEELENKMSDLLTAINSGSVSNVLEVWNKIRNWHIEIDRRVVTTGTNITIDNGGEFVALLCHEIGHTLNTFPVNVYLNYKSGKATSNLITKAMLSKSGKIVQLLLLPMFVCVNGLRIVISTPGREIEEIRADARVPDKYKPYLVSYAQNHIMNYPTARKCILSETEYNNEVKKGVTFSHNCIALMKKRTSILKFHLNTFAKLVDSPYLKQVGELLVKNVTPDNVIMEHAIMESFLRDYNVAEKEANTILETRMISDRDLFLLQCDIDSIQTMDDKIYVLNTIFDYIEICERQREKNLHKFKDLTKIPEHLSQETKLKTLNNMKQQVANIKIQDEVYSVYVKYPKGYEG